MPVAYPQSSGSQNADAAIRAYGPGWFFGADLSGGSAASTLVLHDDASGTTGAVIAQLSCVATGSDHVLCDPPLRVTNGIYANVGGTGATYVVRYA